MIAEQTPLDQLQFMASGNQHQALMELLERPAQPNEGLRDLFSRKAPWDVNSHRPKKEAEASLIPKVVTFGSSHRQSPIDLLIQ
jgi:hypothetical protein